MGETLILVAGHAFPLTHDKHGYWLGRQGCSLIGYGVTPEAAQCDLVREAKALHAAGLFDPLRSRHCLSAEAVTLGKMIAEIAEAYPDAD